MFTQQLSPRFRGPRARRARGLTLMETALATVIVGSAVLAIVRLVTAVSTQSFYAQKTTTALMLANNIREVMNGLPFNDPATGTHLGPNASETSVAQFNDCQDFHGYVASPPIDANREVIANMINWQQSVSVIHVNPNNYLLTDPLPTDAACNMDRIRVVISYQGTGSNTWTPVTTVEWLKGKI